MAAYRNFFLLPYKSVTKRFFFNLADDVFTENVLQNNISNNCNWIYINIQKNWLNGYQINR